jgi:hypothetical protein
MATVEFWPLAENTAAKRIEKSVRADFQEFNEVLRKPFCWF